MKHLSSHRYLFPPSLRICSDSDADCDIGLICGQRDGTDTVNGCIGSGISGKDYCHVPPPPTDSPTRAPTPLCLEIGEDCSQSAESECCSGVCGVDGLCGTSYPPLTYVSNGGTNYNACEGKLSDKLLGGSVSLLRRKKISFSHQVGLILRVNPCLVSTQSPNLIFPFIYINHDDLNLK